MIRNLDTTLMRTFVTVADKASMTAAANALHLTQGAVSQQVRRLEEALGRSLFERDRRGLRLTSAGERLFGKAKRLLSLNDEIWAEMAANAVAGQVRFGVPYDLVGTTLAPVLKAYAQTYPQVEISLVCASSPELAAALAAGTIDLAVIEERVGASDGECLAIDRLVWVGAKGGLARAKRPLPVSMVADSCAFRPVVLSALHEHGLEWRTVFENGNIDATTATVRSDLAVTTWLASTVPADLDILPSESGLPPLPNFSINLHLPRHGVGPAAQAFARHIRDGLARRPQAA
ncbi:LysR family transcriptional regulator [Mesorhizobium sp. B2-4-2]|nr:LysR family transcriptional regulator [Mesorhizobium sp. BR-1-1-8]TPJ59572.1 LysR family transcriptional regulator [Mesorhizobium sp. B2-6-1]TPL07427.1 LysR family transcriptional regulator [Mesorhizobium sp. B2-4-11]TPL33193.1 LysR family transcriptional regulator [Mesorhizobium sp. B2-4-8]TPL60354.1 LysR family transcriptional regulator [Mesorhizobium sp. B2-4-2]TPL65813.1 LysR family transcriptional regulator [Mesorhizobium sp. B2-4-1]TPN13934.1 LysR family transcriptional regulator [Me